MDRNIKLIAYHNFFTDFRFHEAVLVIYFAQITKSYALAMSLFSATMLSQAFFEVPTGIYSDRIGRRKTLILGSIASFIASIFNAIGISYWILFVGAVFAGLSRSFYSGNNNALLYDSLEASGQKTKYAEILGKTSSLFQLALALSAVIGSVIAYFSFPVIMWMSVVPQLLCVVVSIFIMEPPRLSKDAPNIFAHLKSSVKLLFTHRKLRLVSLQDIFSYGINESTFIFRSAFVAILWPLWAVGISKFMSFAGATISFWYSGRIIKKFGEIKTLLFCRIYGRVVGLLSYGLPNILSPVLISTTSLFFGTVSVASGSFAQKFLTQRERATIPSITSFFGSIFISIFSIFVGVLADNTGPAKALFISEIISSFVLLLIFRLYKISRE